MCLWGDTAQPENIGMVLQFDFFFLSLMVFLRFWGLQLKAEKKKLEAKQTVDAKSHQLLKTHLPFNKIK